MFIILNGVDGSGKDTQYQKLLGEYPGAVQLREPGGTPIAEVIRDVILNPDYTTQDRLALIAPLISNPRSVTDCKAYLQQAYDEMHQHGISALAEVYLYAASRVQTNQTLVIPAKNEGKAVLGRRSVACSMSYQGHARQTLGIDMDFVWQTNANAIHGAFPDLEIFLDLPPEVAFERLRGRTEKQDRLDNESSDFHTRTRDGYLHYYQDFCPYPYVILPAIGSVDEVFEKIKATISNFKRQ